MPFAQSSLCHAPCPRQTRPLRTASPRRPPPWLHRSQPPLYPPLIQRRARACRFAVGLAWRQTHLPLHASASCRLAFKRSCKSQKEFYKRLEVKRLARQSGRRRNAQRDWQAPCGPCIPCSLHPVLNMLLMLGRKMPNRLGMIHKQLAAHSSSSFSSKWNTPWPLPTRLSCSAEALRQGSDWALSTCSSLLCHHHQSPTQHHEAFDQHPPRRRGRPAT